MNEFESLKELYMKQLRKIIAKDDISPADDEVVRRVLDTWKKLDDCCCDKEEYPESHYSERRGRNMYNGRYISRHDSPNQRMIDKLNTMQSEAPDDETRMAIERCIETIRRGM